MFCYFFAITLHFLYMKVKRFYSKFQFNRLILIIAFSAFFLAILDCTTSSKLASLPEQLSDVGTNEDVQHSTRSAEQTNLQNEEVKTSTKQVSEIKRQLLQLMMEILDMAAEYEKDLDEDIALQKNILEELETLNQENTELKEKIVALYNAPCENAPKYPILEILAKLIPDIRIDLFTFPILALKQIFSIF
ncbi:hypothetical protein XENTR_v10013473 [Xenopus tropicalis]|nr:hypothetical protein XENTR_v10013473 [Xenopus tropicalis]